MLKFPAIKINQHGKEIYSFKAIGKDILSFASIDRIKRDPLGNLVGYQRVEVTKHIKEITNYLADERSILANSIVICFDSHIKFEPLEQNSDFGYLTIPAKQIYGQIVDGQQRSTALQNLASSKFEVAINAFITDNVDEQREQFLLINNTKPLPKPLIYELLPEVSSELPSSYQDKQLPNRLISILNTQVHSPFYHIIKTHTYPDGYIKDNTLIKAINSSLTDGILYEFSAHELGMNDVESMCSILNAFWGAVQKIFPKEWKMNPKETRLTHGAGILALSNLMEIIVYKKILKINPNYLDEKSFITSDFEKYLEPLREKINWSNGKYDFSNGYQRNIMDIQNTGKDIDMFKHYLIGLIK